MSKTMRLVPRNSSAISLIEQHIYAQHFVPGNQQATLAGSLYPAGSRVPELERYTLSKRNKRLRRNQLFTLCVLHEFTCSSFFTESSSLNLDEQLYESRESPPSVVSGGQIVSGRKSRQAPVRFIDVQRASKSAATKT